MKTTKWSPQDKMKKEIVRLEGVSKTHILGKVKLEILKRVNLKIFSGDFVVIVGPSGSGKSTLLNLISCLDVPTSGQIFFHEKDISHFSEDALAEVRGKKIGFVFQQFNLLLHLTALENVIMPTIFQGIEENRALELGKRILTELGLEERMKHRPTELSGGESQRVAIARALINNPEIIVADEPTGNIDSKTGEKIMKILKKFNEEGRTIIMVTHDQDLLGYGNKIIRIKDGEVIEQ